MNINSEIAEELKDFTYYPNATCEFSRTSNAIPYLLTGTSRPRNMSELEYTEYAYSESDFLKQIQNAGYKIGLYTNEDLVPEKYRGVAENNNDDIKKQCGFFSTIFTMMECSKYRMAPLCFKDYYYYYTSVISDLIDNKEIWNIDNDYPFYEKLMKKGLSISKDTDSKGKFYFYHMFGTHGPTNLSENMKPVESGSVSMEEQTQASMNIVLEYLKQLKEIGRYEDATIIITADHGVQLDAQYYKENNVVDRTTNPVILIKESKGNHDKMVVNEKPVSQSSFIPTVFEALDISYNGSDKVFDDVIEEDNSEFDLTKLVIQLKEEAVYESNGSNVEMWGDVDKRTSDNIASLIIRIYSKVSDKAFKQIFGIGKEPKKDLCETIESFISNKSKHILRIGFEDVPYDFQTREILANAIAKFLLNKARKGDFKTQPIVFFADEAHQFLNKEVKDEYFQSMRLDSFDSIAKECRKYGLFLCLATQMPRDIPLGTLSQMGTFLVHRLINHKDKEAVESACSAANKSTLAYLPVLGAGEAILMGVDFPMPVMLKVNLPQTEPNSHTPQFKRL